MSLILNIDTALDRSSICLAKNGVAIAIAENNNHKDQSGWPHQSIQDLLRNNNMDVAALDAVAVSNGPGSYTGLRVGLSVAKGLCFALNIPLITINTLELLAYAVKDEMNGLIVPMIDARRMEVFTATYDHTLREINPPQAVVLQEESFNEILKNAAVLFCGNGSPKWKLINTHPNAHFSNTLATASHLASVAHERLLNKQFADLAYAEPFYVKEFFSGETKK